MYEVYYKGMKHQTGTSDNTRHTSLLTVSIRTRINEVLASRQSMELLHAQTVCETQTVC